MKNMRFVGGLCLAACVSTTSLADVKQVALEVSTPHSQLLADQKQLTYVKVGMTGFHMPRERERAPVNVSIVLDRSGSMAGEKLERAKDAAKEAISHLSGDDIFSLVVYDTAVDVLVPATKVSDRELLHERIDSIRSGQSTALFAGVSKGAAELRKFLDMERVNRVILLSDGIANQGPSSPSELGDLGASLIKEGISVTTIGLGLDYNEDLMAKLADRSDGNHVFVEHPNQLVGVFNEEFGDILSVVAQEVMIQIRTAESVRPVRVLGWEADISGNLVEVAMNQIYSDQEKYVILEVEVPPGSVEDKLQLASVELAYANMATRKTDRLSGTAEVTFTVSKELVARSIDRDVMVSCTTQIGAANNAKATSLRDQGKVDQARQVLLDNGRFLQERGRQLDSYFLLQYGLSNNADASALDSDSWDRQRKIMRFGQQLFRKQQSLGENEATRAQLDRYGLPVAAPQKVEPQPQTDAK